MKQKKEEKSNSVAGGLFWTFGERITAQFVTTIVTILLARLLDPYHYGIISIVSIFITFCNIFVSGGFGSAVVQKKNATLEDFNTMFTISFVASIVLYLLLFLTAPYISDFYEIQELTPVIRVMGIRLILASLNTIQHSYIQRQMKFKKFFIATLFGTVISAVLGLFLAYKGFGVWALVAQYISNTLIDTIVLLFVVGWIPRFQFVKSNAKQLFGFGWKVLVSEFIFKLSDDIKALIVGKVFGSEDLAFYDQGKKYPSFVVNNINSSINKVMLPAFSKKQDNVEELKTVLRKSIKIGLYILSPILLGFAVCANGFVSVVLTDKWLECVPYIQIFSVVYLMRPIESTCYQAILAMGDSNTTMKIIIAINVVVLSFVLFSVFALRSVLFVAFSSLIGTVVSILLYMFIVKKRINYNIYEQIKDASLPIIISIIMCLVVFAVGFIKISKLKLLVIQILVGIVMYFILSLLFKPDGYKYIMSKITKTFKKIIKHSEN